MAPSLRLPHAAAAAAGPVLAAALLPIPLPLARRLILAPAALHSPLLPAFFEGSACPLVHDAMHQAGQLPEHLQEGRQCGDKR